MVEFIACAIALFIVHGIPAILQSKEEHKRLEDLYSPKNNDHSTDEWRR